METEIPIHLSCTVLSFLATDHQDVNENPHHADLEQQVFFQKTIFFLMLRSVCPPGLWYLQRQLSLEINKISVSKHCMSTCTFRELFGNRKPAIYPHCKPDALVHEMVYYNVALPLRLITSEFTTSIPNYDRAYSQTNICCISQMKHLAFISFLFQLLVACKSTWEARLKILLCSISCIVSLY